MRALTVPQFALILGVLFGLIADARGQTPAQWRSRTVAVLPVRSYIRAPADFMGTSPQIADLRADAGQWQRVLEDGVGRLAQIELVSAAALRQKAGHRGGIRESMALATERLALGIERYRALDTAEAGRQLARARALSMDAFADLLDPGALADINLYRGLTLLENGNAGGGHIALRELLLMAPGRAFQPGYYPTTVEATLKAAWADLMGQVDLRAARFPPERLRQASDALDIQIWVSALIAGTVDAPVLHLSIIDPLQRILGRSARIPLSDPDQARIAVARVLSAWHTCALEVVETPPPPKAPATVYIDLTYTHTLFLKHDGTRALFQNPGASLTITWEPAETLLLFARGGQMASLPDPNTDLIEPVSLTRIMFGAGLVGGSEDIRAFVQTGVELAILGRDFAMTTDVDCKHFGADHPLCGQYTRVSAPRLLLGFRLEVGIRVAFVDRWFVVGSVGLTNYFLDAEVIADLNVPFDMSLGLGTRF